MSVKAGEVDELTGKDNSMSVYSKILNQRVTKVETQLAAAQKTGDANRPSVLQDVLAEGDRVLQPCMWDWILETTEPPQGDDLVSRIASMLAADQGWELTGGWGESRRYWWALKGCAFFCDKLNTDGLFYFFGCSRAEFYSLTEHVTNKAWTEAVRRLTTVLRDPRACGFNRHRPDEALLLVDALSKCNLPQLVRPHLPVIKGQAKGSKEALVAWLNVEIRRQYAKKGIIK